MVFFFDESRFGLHPSIGRCWARKGVRVSAPVNPSYQNFYVYSGVSPLTGDAFSLFLPWVNTEMMNLYLAEMSAAFPDKEIMLIWDQAGWHKSNSLKVPDNIVLKSLPPYSPELNPVEKLWQWLKKHVCRNRLFAYLDDLMNTLAETFLKDMHFFSDEMTVPLSITGGTVFLRIQTIEVLPSIIITIQILFCQIYPQFYKEAGQPGRDSSRLYFLQYSYEGSEDSLYAGEAPL